MILSLLTSRVEEESSSLGVLGESEAESRDFLGGRGGQYSSRLLNTSLARNTSSMGSQSSPMPLLRQAGNAYNSDSRRWRARPVQLSVGDSEYGHAGVLRAWEFLSGCSSACWGLQPARGC